MPQRSNTDRLLALGALALLMIGCLVVARPFLTALLWAAILVSVTWPAGERLLRVCRGRHTLAASLMTLLLVLILLGPFVVVLLGLADNAGQLARVGKAFLESGLPPAPAWLATLPLGDHLTAYWADLAIDRSHLFNELSRFAQPARNALLTAGRVLGNGVSELSLSIFFAFFLYRDGPALAARLRGGVSRLGGERGLQLLSLARQTVSGVVYGIIGTALAQGVLAAIGFAIAGVPGALLLGLGTFFLSVVPVGPPLIWGAAAFWLFREGQTGWAIFMVLWGLLVVSMVDNIIKPYIISQGSNLPFALVLVGILGGVMAFGLIGVFLGPTLLAAGYRLLAEWTVWHTAGQESAGSRK